MSDELKQQLWQYLDEQRSTASRRSEQLRFWVEAGSDFSAASAAAGNVVGNCRRWPCP